MNILSRDKRDRVLQTGSNVLNLKEGIIVLDNFGKGKSIVKQFKNTLHGSTRADNARLTKMDLGVDSYSVHIFCQIFNKCVIVIMIAKKVDQSDTILTGNNNRLPPQNPISRNGIDGKTRSRLVLFTISGQLSGASPTPKLRVSPLKNNHLLRLFKLNIKQIKHHLSSQQNFFTKIGLCPSYRGQKNMTI